MRQIKPRESSKLGQRHGDFFKRVRRQVEERQLTEIIAERSREMDDAVMREIEVFEFLELENGAWYGFQSIIGQVEHAQL